ncbi:MAG: translation initiation factor IF-2, partial [Bacteroidales bacterium]|nr:translation initiation factor IF-2 [Bacteroidales bacterium]
MPEEKVKKPRLGQAATEFNVSMDRIIDILTKNGLEISSPTLNSKLTEEMYLCLQKELAKDKMVKEKSDQILTPKTKKEETKTVAAPAPAEEETTGQHIIIHTTKLPEVKTVEVPVSHAPEVKIIGSVDPETLARPSGKKSSGTAKEADAKQQEPAKVEETPKETPAVPQEEPATETPDQTSEPTEPKEEEPAPKPEHIETVAHLPGPEILGTIDLEALKPKKKSSSKDKKGQKKEKEKPKQPKQQPKAAEAPKPEPKKETPATPVAPQPEQPVVEHIKTVVNPLKGPKILGTIDLSLLQQSSGGGKNDHRVGDSDKKKRKRKRVAKPVKSSSNANVKDDKDKKQKQEPEKVEISAEDIHRRIKETKMRLENNAKKNTTAAKRRKEKRQLIHERIEEQEMQAIEDQKTLRVTEFITANELATLMNVDVTKIIATCMSIGLFVSINQRLDAENIVMLAEEFGFNVEFIDADDDSDAEAGEQDAEEDLQPRHPIITVMGHVDHGKTSLLDYIRKTNVIAGEAGGITQHIGAYNVKLEDGRHITFLDTPGHEAFTAMRARGAQVTDIAIIIIAADDDIMPQTKEAINHAVAAGVPIVFAINKIDKPAANPDKIKEHLAQMNFLVEDWGGKYQSQDISAKKGIGVPELMEKVLLEAEMLDLKANPNRKATGSIIESSLDKGRGYVATLLCSNGTLKMGDILLAGTNYGRIKAMFNERGQRIKEIGPAQAATILGLNGAPQAGDTFHVMDTDQEAREIASKREQLQREQGIRTQHHLTLDEIGRRIEQGGFQELNVIVKGDVDGSIEALSDSLIKLSTEKIAVNVIHKAVGQISENDVSLAAASDAIIVAFQVRPSAQARKVAEQQGVEIRTYSIIYDAIEEVKEAMEGMLAPELKEEITAQLEVRQVFHISKVGTVAGAYVIDGKVSRTNKARIIRDGIVIHTGQIDALKRFKDDVKEVSTNFECGISLVNYSDIQEGDTIETFQ